MAGVLEIVGVGSDRRLWHSLRRLDGSGPRRFALVQDQAGGGPPVILDAGCSRSSEGALHVVAVGVNGDLWHTIRHARGAWQSYFGNVEDQTRSGPPYVQRVSILAIGTGLHVVGAAGWGLWHTFRHADGTWSRFDCIGNQSVGPTGLSEAAMGSEDGEHLLVIGIAERATMWFITATATRAEVLWDGPYRAVQHYASGGPAAFTTVSCAGAGGVAHVVAVGSDGQLWHNVFDRKSAALFTAFRPVAPRSTQGPPSFVDVGCASLDGRSVHVVGLGSDGQLWQTIRDADGTWQPTFDLVESQSLGGETCYLAVDCEAGGGGSNRPAP
jgi:hypothetical protein